MIIRGIFKGQLPDVIHLGEEGVAEMAEMLAMEASLAKLDPEKDAWLYNLGKSTLEKKTREFHEHVFNVSAEDKLKEEAKAAIAKYDLDDGPCHRCGGHTNPDKPGACNCP